jgi:ATP synthase protein I
MRDSNLHIIRPLQRGACRAQSEMNSTSRRNEPSIAKPGILRWQCIELAVLVLTTALIAVMDSELARAIAVGGLIALIPQMYFAFHAFRFRGARAMRQVTHSFYRGEAGKFLLTCGLFAIVFMAMKPREPIAVLLSFMVWHAINLAVAAAVVRR